MPLLEILIMSIGQELIRQACPESIVAKPQHIIALICNDGHLGRHTRLKKTLTVINKYNRLVVDDIVLYDWRIPDLNDLTAERAIPVSVHQKHALLSVTVLSNIRFGATAIVIHMSKA